MFRAAQRMRLNLLHALIGALVVLPAGLPSAAADTLRSPEIVVREIFDEVLRKLDAARAGGALDDAQARAIFGEVLNPRIAYDELARWILKGHWTSASDTQRAAFLTAFEGYIIQTYALALSTSEDIALVVADDPQLRKKAAIVHGRFSVEDSVPVPIQFRLLERDGRWVLFDVSVEGVSLALTFRSDFNYVAKDGGIDAITRHLEQRTGS